MSNANKNKIKASETSGKFSVDEGIREAEAKKQGLVQLFAWLGVLSIIAYFVILYVFWKNGRGNVNKINAYMLADVIVGVCGSLFLIVSGWLSKAKKMLLIAIGLLGLFFVLFYINIMLLLNNVEAGTFGGILACLTGLSFVASIILLIVSAIRAKVKK